MNKEYIISQIIGTPFEQPAKQIRRTLEQYQGRHSPEWDQLRAEDALIDVFIKKTLTPNMNCVDIGCHLGSVLSQFCHYAPQGRHIAFEPLPYKAAWLRRRYPKVGIYEMALSDTTGTAGFYYQRNASGFSGLRVHVCDSGDDNTQEIEVEVRRLDEIAPAHRRVGFIKLDVEGAEIFTLRGASALLCRDRPLMLFECTESGMNAFGYTPCDIYTLLTEQHRYNISLIGDYLADKPSLSYESFRRSQSYPAQAFNFVAHPKRQ
jgi:FkbM family methyltransferase